MEDDAYRSWLDSQGFSLERYPACPSDNFVNGAGSSRLSPEAFLGSFLADRAIEMLEGFAEEQCSFFLAVSDFAPHPPFAVPPPYDTCVDPGEIKLSGNCQPGEEALLPRMIVAWRKSIVERRDLSPGALRRLWAHYLGLCRLMDHNFGRIRDALHRLGLAESTDVVFLSDHGEMLGSHGLLHKGPYFYREQMRIPLLAAGPGIPAGKEIDPVVSLVDVLPTVAERLGRPVPGDLDGRSLLPLMRGEGFWDREAVFAENHRNIKALGGGPYPGRAVFSERWKYHWHPDDRDELYDLESDPGEMVNLAGSRDVASVRDHLRMQLGVH